MESRWNGRRVSDSYGDVCSVRPQSHPTRSIGKGGLRLQELKVLGVHEVLIFWHLSEVDAKGESRVSSL